MSTLNILCWDGYDHQFFIDGLKAETGIRLSAEPLVSDQAAADQVNRADDSVDLININNPYPRRQLYPQGGIIALDTDRLTAGRGSRFDWLAPLTEWQFSESGEQIGVCQRFGAFNFVVNTRKISVDTATNLGFGIVQETVTSLPYGILLFPEFNIFHICIAANLSPFLPLDSSQLDAFERTARFWFRNASIVSDDSALLNRALAAGDIAYFLSGGVFTSGAARLEGQLHIECITPASGPIDGKGAISFMEITAITSHCRSISEAYQFLNYLIRPEISVSVATNPAVCNPVVQMEDPAVIDQMSQQFLQAIQWDSIEQDISRCAPYRLPPSYDALFDRLTTAQRAETS